MIEHTYDAIDLAEWYYIVSYSFEFKSANRWTRLEFVTTGTVCLS